MRIGANSLGILLAALAVVGMVSERAEAQGFHTVTCTSAGGQSCNVNSESRVISLMKTAGIKPQLQDTVTARDVNTNALSTWTVTGVGSDGYAFNLGLLGSSTSGTETCVDGPDPDAPEMGEEGEVECTEPDPSPILLDLDRNQFHLSGGPVLFDIDADGQFETVSWVAPDTQDAFLFLDRNGNGIVDDGSELFGNATLLFSGQQAEHGYEALAEFDQLENGGSEDGVIDSADSVFADLRVWIDEDANGICDENEPLSLAEANVLSLDLNYHESPRIDGYGNEFRYISRGSMEVNGKRKEMWTTDVFFQRLPQ